MLADARACGSACMCARMDARPVRRPSGVRRLILMAGCRNELNDTRGIAKVNNSPACLFAVIYVVGE